MPEALADDFDPVDPADGSSDERVPMGPPPRLHVKVQPSLGQDNPPHASVASARHLDQGGNSDVVRHHGHFTTGVDDARGALEQAPGWASQISRDGSHSEAEASGADRNADVGASSSPVVITADEILVEQDTSSKAGATNREQVEIADEVVDVELDTDDDGSGFAPTMIMPRRAEPPPRKAVRARLRIIRGATPVHEWDSVEAQAHAAPAPQPVDSVSRTRAIPVAASPAAAQPRVSQPAPAASYPDRSTQALGDEAPIAASATDEVITAGSPLRQDELPEIAPQTSATVVGATRRSPQTALAQYADGAKGTSLIVPSAWSRPNDAYLEVGIGTEGLLIVPKNTTLHGPVQAVSAIVDGEIIGHLKVSETVIVQPGGVVGTIDCGGQAVIAGTVGRQEPARSVVLRAKEIVFGRTALVRGHVVVRETAVFYDGSSICGRIHCPVTPPPRR